MSAPTRAPGASGPPEPEGPAAVPSPPSSLLPLDARVAELRADPSRTWGLADVGLGVLAAPASLLLAGLLLALVDLPGAVALAVASTALVALTVLAVRRPARQSGGVERALGLDLPTWSDTGLALRWSVGLFALQVLAGGLLALLVPDLRGVAADNTSFLADVPPAVVVLVALTAVAVAPVVEELLFRGLVLRGLMLRTGFWPAAVVSSVLFGLLHAQATGLEALPLVVATGVFGLGLCVLARRTGRLGPGILVHALRNAVAIGAVVLTAQ